MQYIIIEKFHPGKIKEMYQRFDEKGRMLPKGVIYINSWIDENITTCYQVMESDSMEKLHQWTESWKDIVDFEIIPVISSDQARIKVLSSK